MIRRATPERLSAFSDGVFAVLITVLVLDLRPPDVPTFGALLSLWPTWLSYAVSYLFIAIVWTNHHYLMRYAGEATPHQRQMFADSLHAALSLDEIRGLIASLGFARDGVQQTSDRHWTWNTSVRV